MGGRRECQRLPAKGSGKIRREEGKGTHLTGELDSYLSRLLVLQSFDFAQAGSTGLGMRGVEEDEG